MRKPESRSENRNNVIIITIEELYSVKGQNIIKVDTSQFFFPSVCVRLQAEFVLRSLPGMTCLFVYCNKFPVGRHYVEQFGRGIASSHGLCLVRKKQRVQKEVDLLHALRGIRKQGH